MAQAVYGSNSSFCIDFEHRSQGRQQIPGCQKQWRSATRPNPAMAPSNRWAFALQVNSNALIAGKNSMKRKHLIFIGDSFTTLPDTKKIEDASSDQSRI